MKTFLLSRTYPLPRMTGTLIMKISSSLSILMVWEGFLFYSPPPLPPSLSSSFSSSFSEKSWAVKEQPADVWTDFPLLRRWIFMCVIMFPLPLICRCGGAPAPAFTLALCIRSRRSTAGEIPRWGHTVPRYRHRWGSEPNAKLVGR